MLKRISCCWNWLSRSSMNTILKVSRNLSSTQVNFQTKIYSMNSTQLHTTINFKLSNKQNLTISSSLTHNGKGAEMRLTSWLLANRSTHCRSLTPSSKKMGRLIIFMKWLRKSFRNIPMMLFTRWWVITLLPNFHLKETGSSLATVPTQIQVSQGKFFNVKFKVFL